MCRNNFIIVTVFHFLFTVSLLMGKQENAADCQGFYGSLNNQSVKSAAICAVFALVRHYWSAVENKTLANITQSMAQMTLHSLKST
jgi:hypothetical protein